MDAPTLENDIAARVLAVDERRAGGLSVAAACRASGISTSMYYRRRRAAEPREPAGALVAQPVAASWPYPAATPSAPLYWDQAFHDEMSDSFVRREFGAGGAKFRPARPVAAFALPANPGLARLVLRARKFLGRLRTGPAVIVVGPLAAMALLALLVVTAGWMVSLAADPAAWLADPVRSQVAAATGPLSR